MEVKLHRPLVRGSELLGRAFNNIGFNATVSTATNSIHKIKQLRIENR